MTQPDDDKFTSTRNSESHVLQGHTTDVKQGWLKTAQRISLLNAWKYFYLEVSFLL